jgi:AcrR family transcriptional regulator
MAARAGLDYAAVVQTAANLADEMGIEGVNLSVLAEKLGVRTPTLYHYVSGLAGLQRAVALHGLELLRDRLGEVAMGRSGDEAVLAAMTAYRNFVKAHPGVYMATVRAAPQDDAEWQMRSQQVLDVVLRVLSAYKLDDEEALHAVRLLRSVLHGFTSLEQDGGFGIPLEIEETFKRLQQMFLTYLPRGVQ